MSQSFATADALDMVDYFGAIEKLAQPWKTSDEEFLPGEWGLGKRGWGITKKKREKGQRCSPVFICLQESRFSRPSIGWMIVDLADTYQRTAARKVESVITLPTHIIPRMLRGSALNVSHTDKWQEWFSRRDITRRDVSFLFSPWIRPVD